MRVLVTGGFGLLGSRLAHKLSETGCKIVLTSRLDRSVPQWLPGAICKQIDWYNKSALEAICEDVEIVIHAAGMNAGDCARDPAAALRFNGEATRHLAKAAARTDVRKFLLLSTAHVYASPLVGSINEETTATNQHPYATSKLAGEVAAAEVAQATDLQVLAIRLSNAFGAPMQKDADCWHLLMNDLCRQAAQLGNLRLQSSGRQHRDFIPISVFCEFLIELLAKPCWEGISPVLNVGSGSAQSVLDASKLVQQRAKRLLNRKIDLQIPEDTSPENETGLHFHSTKLPLPEVTIEKVDAEIDNLLAFCVQHFSSDRAGS